MKNRGKKYTEALSKVEKGKLIVLDLYSDAHTHFGEYYGHDAVYCMLPKQVFGHRGCQQKRLTSLMKPTIEQTILVHQRVGKALSMLEARMADLGITEFLDELHDVRDDYDRMADSLSQGQRDPSAAPT